MVSRAAEVKFIVSQSIWVTNF